MGEHAVVLHDGTVTVIESTITVPDGEALPLYAAVKIAEDGAVTVVATADTFASAKRFGGRIFSVVPADRWEIAPELRSPRPGLDRLTDKLNTLLSGGSL